MSSEKPSENPKERMERRCTSCDGSGKIKPPGAVREAMCQKCQGKGWTLGK
jgi:DnaJ-class molecular chaperone